MENSFTLIKHVQARDISLEAATDVNLVGRCFEGNRTSAVMLTWPHWRFENKHSIWTEARDMRLETVTGDTDSIRCEESYQFLHHTYLCQSAVCSMIMSLFQDWLGVRRNDRLPSSNCETWTSCLFAFMYVSLVLSSSRHKPTHIWNQKHLLKIIFLLKKKDGFPFVVSHFWFLSLHFILNRILVASHSLLVHVER